MKKTLPEILKTWERNNGGCWVSEIQRMAESGLSWADAAEFFDVPRYRLVSLCHRRGFKFPWQGHRSQVQREHQRRMTLDNPSSGRPPKRYLYKGQHYTLKELAELSSLPVTTLQCRLHRGLTIEQATEQPYIDHSTRSRMGGLETRRRHGKTNKPFEVGRVANATHGLQTQGDMGRTQ